MTLSSNLLGPAGPSNLLGPAGPTTPLKPEKEEPREFGDVTAARNNTYASVLKAMQEMEPVSNQRHTLRLSNPEYIDPETWSLADQKKAILSGQSQGRRVRGTWELVDNETNKVLDSRKQVIASVPFMTPRGTYIHNGNEYTLRNQQRLRSGSFTRVRENGEIETHANILPGKGRSHHYFLDPAKGVFYTRVGQAKIPLMPLLKAMGATPKELREAWGNDLYATNFSKDEGAAIKKYAGHVLKKDDIDDDTATTAQKVVDRWQSMEMDPDVTKHTLGKPYANLSKEAIIDTTKKLLAVSKGEADPDDRDNLAFQQFLGPEDLFSERIRKDHGQLRRQLLFKATGKGDLSGMPSSALKKQLEAALLTSGLGQPLEEINPAEIYDKLHSISRLGEGGIPSMDAVPDEARSVQPSHFGFVDPLRTPESARVGVDVYLSSASRKGRDGKLYTKFRDPKTGKDSWYTPQQVSDKVVAFPGALNRRGKRVSAFKDGRQQYVKKREVDLVLPAMEGAFSPLGNMVPMKSMVKGGRAVMAARLMTQALPVEKAESPWVQSAVPGTNESRSYDDEYAKHMGALRAQKPGRVEAVTPESIKVKYNDGTRDELELYNNFPFNRKTYLHQTAMLKPGDSFDADQLLARSNYTDDAGTTALGKNARVAYLSWQGKNFEDAIVISESFANKMRSEHMYQNELEADDRTKLGKKAFVSLFASRYPKEAIAKLGPNGIIKPGMTVEKGDPLILAARQRELSQNKVHKKRQAGHVDASVTWDHHDPGVVTDVIEGKKGPVVLVKSAASMQVGDKMSGRYGDKGVISAIIPDGQMPHDANKQPYEVLLNPLGVISRGNPAQKAELYLGKLAQLQGKPIKVEDFGDQDYTEWALEKLRKAGLSDTEDVYDPTNDSKIKGIATGSRYFFKAHHTAETKAQARGGGAYTQDDAPAKGGPTGSKRISMLDANALLSHGATATLRDAGAVRGQRNEQYWLQFMKGYNPSAPKVPLAYEKFVNQLKASGINVVRQGTQTNVMALTDKDIDALAGPRNLKNSEGVDWGQGLAPRAGGLFDKKLTGGHNGKRWAAIKLNAPMPNPVMEEPIRHMLGLTGKQFEEVIAGDRNIGTAGTGTQAIAKVLENFDIDREIQQARAQVQMGNKSERDKAVRKLGYLKSAKKTGVHPKDWMLTRAPVLPPAFRPVSMMGSNVPLVSDPNFLYKDLMEANDNLKLMKKEVGEDGIGAERLATYHAFKAVTGLGDPIGQQSRDKKASGILKHVFGSSPKFGTMQRKLISSTVDQVGRSVITPNPDFDMDTVGLPEEKAFDIYGKFIARRLHRRGLPLTKALEAIRERTELARDALIEEMDERPVFINRAPVLHKYGIMAFNPRLVKGDTMQVSPLIVKGFNADFDGDAMQFHVPTDSEAVKEAYERMLPSRSLISPADFKTPMHAPGQEYVAGLYHATKAKSKRPVKKFRSKKDAKAAYERGEIALDDRIQILED